MGDVYTNASSSSPQYISLPVAFPNAITFAVVSDDGANSSATEEVAVDWSTAGRTTTSRVAIFSNYAGTARMFAIGY